MVARGAGRAVAGCRGAQWDVGGDGGAPDCGGGYMTMHLSEPRELYTQKGESYCM